MSNSRVIKIKSAAQYHRHSFSRTVTARNLDVVKNYMTYFSHYKMKNYRLTKRILWEVLNAERNKAAHFAQLKTTYAH